jgi:hypothetical protein
MLFGRFTADPLGRQIWNDDIRSVARSGRLTSWGLFWSEGGADCTGSAINDPRRQHRITIRRTVLIQIIHNKF